MAKRPYSYWVFFLSLIFPKQMQEFADCFYEAGYLDAKKDHDRR